MAGAFGEAIIAKARNAEISTPSRLEIKMGKFPSPAVSDGCQWSRRPTEQLGQ